MLIKSTKAADALRYTLKRIKGPMGKLARKQFDAIESERSRLEWRTIKLYLANLNLRHQLDRKGDRTDDDTIQIMEQVYVLRLADWPWLAISPELERQFGPRFSYEQSRSLESAYSRFKKEYPEKIDQWATEHAELLYHWILKHPKKHERNVAAEGITLPAGWLDSFRRSVKRAAC